MRTPIPSQYLHPTRHSRSAMCTMKNQILSTHRGSDVLDASDMHEDENHARRTNSPVRVSTTTCSPTVMYGGTLICVWRFLGKCACVCNQVRVGVDHISIGVFSLMRLVHTSVATCLDMLGMCEEHCMRTSGKHHNTTHTIIHTPHHTHHHTPAHPQDTFPTCTSPVTCAGL